MSGLYSTEIDRESLPILILDIWGIFAKELILQIRKKSQEQKIVVVSKKIFKDFPGVVRISPNEFRLDIILRDKFSYIFFIDDNSSGDFDLNSNFLEQIRASQAITVIAVPVEKQNDRILLMAIEESNVKVVVFGDIFGIDGLINKSSIINRFIRQAKTDFKIDVPGDGTAFDYPVSFVDVISAILKVAFSTFSQDKVFFAFPKFPITLLALAHLFQKIDPLIKIDFVAQDQSFGTTKDVFLKGSYIFGSKYPLLERIKDLKLGIDIKVSEAEKPVAVSSETLDVVLKKKHASARSRAFIPFIASVFLLVILPLLSSFIFFYLGLGLLGVTKTLVYKRDFSKAKSVIFLSEMSFNVASVSSGVLSDEMSEINQPGLFSGLIFKSTQAWQFSGFLHSVIGYLPSVIKGNVSSILPYFSDGSLMLENAQAQDSLIASKIEPFNTLLSFLSQVDAVLPNVLGDSGKKTYLILLQNNMELRPGGGFIGSYALLTMDNSKVIRFTIYDVYSADGQLHEHVEPPFAIRRYLPSVNWYLRDSNFNVDFVQSARSAARIFYLESGIKVDGVIGIDLNLVWKILQDIGPVYLSDYNQSVDANNFFKLTEEHAEKNFFPGSTQKKDFLNSLFLAIKSKLSSQNIPYVNLAKSLGDLLTSKDVLFVFNNASIQDVFTVNGYSSSLWDGRSVNFNIFNDFTGINEANLGVNKVNYFISRRVWQQINIAQSGSVSASLKITYVNASNGLWPGGGYKNYLRVILPQGAKLTKVFLDGKPQGLVAAVTSPLIYEKKGFAAPKGLEVNSYSQDGKIIYGFLVNVPAGKTLTVQDNYTLSQKINTKEPFSYNLKLFKQPGTNGYPYLVVLNYPSSLSAAGLVGFVKSANALSFQGKLSQDLDLSANFR